MGEHRHPRLHSQPPTTAICVAAPVAEILSWNFAASATASSLRRCRNRGPAPCVSGGRRRHAQHNRLTECSRLPEHTEYGVGHTSVKPQAAFPRGSDTCSRHLGLCTSACPVRASSVAVDGVGRCTPVRKHGSVSVLLPPGAADCPRLRRRVPRANNGRRPPPATAYPAMVHCRKWDHD